jgi:cellulose synthase/poly-beta-1,6-N-acetylglucosamine synthase-like glycosyltransferase
MGALESMLQIAAGVAAALSVPGTAELMGLTAASLLPRRRRNVPADGSHGPRHLAVIIPAHDEELNIAACVASVRACDLPPCSVDLLVIADNCTDATAERAKCAGAEVLERRDERRRGKGHALQFGFEEALARGAEVVVVIDADSAVSSGLLRSIHGEFQRGALALQVRYEATLEPDAPPMRRLARLAFFAFNVVRPRGRARLGFSAGIFGNGFALSKEALRACPYGALSIVEDLEYHLDLVEAGIWTEFCEEAWVTAPLPRSAQGVRTQRTRWDGGRMRVAATRLPRTILRAFAKPRLFEQVLHLTLLPLGFHALLVLPALVLGPSWATAIASAYFGALVVHLLVAWWFAGSRPTDLIALAWSPIFVARKLLLLPATIAAARRGSPWRRTERDPQKTDDSSRAS